MSARWIQVADDRWVCEIASTDNSCFLSVMLAVQENYHGGYLWSVRLVANNGSDVCLERIWTSEFTRAQEDAENWVQRFGLCLSASLGGDQ